MARKTHTSTEVKQRWINANYARYAVSFRNDNDAELIEYISNRKESGDQTSDIFREAVQALMGQSFDAPELIAQVEDLRKTSWENSSDKYYAGATMAYDNVLQLIKEINTDR